MFLTIKENNTTLASIYCYVSQCWVYIYLQYLKSREFFILVLCMKSLLHTTACLQVSLLQNQIMTQKSLIYFFNSLLITNIHYIKYNNMIKYNLSDSLCKFSYYLLFFLCFSVLSYLFLYTLYLFMQLYAFYLYTNDISQYIGNQKS